MIIFLFLTDPNDSLLFNIIIIFLDIQNKKPNYFKGNG